MSLPLPSCSAALGGMDLVVAHDGKVLQREAATLAELGVLEAPVVVC